MKDNKLFSEAAERYFRWPVLMSLMMLFVNGAVFVVNIKAGFVVGIATVTMFLSSGVIYFFYKKRLTSQLLEFYQSFEQEQRTVMEKFNVPLALLDRSAKVLWHNDMFAIVAESEKAIGRSITNYVTEITKEALPKGDKTEILHIGINRKYYRVELRRINIERTTKLTPEDKKKTVVAVEMFMVNMFDETEEMELKRKLKEQKMVSGIIYVDNFEEAIQTIEEVRRPLLIALIERNINKFAHNIDGILRKLEKDRYFIVFQQKYMAQLQESKFSVLEDIRKLDIGNDMSVTLSVGLGISTESYSESNEFARTALDLALGRGGDQVVVKDGDKISYYGGNKNQLVDKTTRVKSRVKAHALKELIEESEKVFIMGHKLSDLDSLGAAMGLYRGIKQLERRAYIVLNEATSSVKALYDMLISNPEYKEDVFLTNAQAIEMADTNSLLIVVDVSRPSYVECRELLNITKNVVVIDHHRQSDDSIENPALSYIEPYSSSASEMVTELLQYIVEKIKLKPLEADALYAGMCVDTKNFMNKVGVKTFEAAAYLRKSGADALRVRKLFKNDLASYKAKAAAVTAAVIVKEHFAITVCNIENIESPTIVAAQTADELLNIQGIKASFVLTLVNGLIYISARAMEDINVQVIMEHFGGGGHQNVAGAQVKNSTIDEVIRQLEVLVDKIEIGGDN